MKRRMAIFCFWEKNGIVAKSDEYLISQLREVSDILVIVVNGKIQSNHQVLELADIIIYRENAGFDMGAYKAALFHEEVEKELSLCEELILCNNSFFGPFISLQELFQKMDEKKADFWGLSYVECSMSQHIQSYFLVYKSSIIKSNVLREFFRKYVNENAEELIEASGVFEIYLFVYLRSKGYQYAAYVDPINYNIYRSPYYSLKRDQLPLLKKKVFRNSYCDKQEVFNVLKYINDTYNYDVEIILQDIKDLYGTNISREEIVKHVYYEKKAEKMSLYIEHLKMEQILRQSEAIYIYGMGVYAKRIYWNYIYARLSDKFLGFIVSDNQEAVGDTYKGEIIHRWSQIKDDKNNLILVALNEKNTEEVREQFVGRKNVIFIWDMATRKVECNAKVY